MIHQGIHVGIYEQKHQGVDSMQLHGNDKLQVDVEIRVHMEGKRRHMLCIHC